jgi:hypothetical protein
MLDRINIQNVSEDAALWEKVVWKLRTGAMPPPGAPRPDAQGVDSFSSYFETALDRIAAANPNAGRPAPHRLNRAEYANALRDVLGLEIDPAGLLPADDAGRGFDNISEVLSVSPLLVERYMAAARKISNLAVGDPETRPFTQSYDVSRRLFQDDRMSEDLPFGSRGGLAIRHHFPLDGEYVVKIRLQRNNDNYIKGLAEPHQLDVRLEGARVRLFTVGGEPKAPSGPIYSFINRCCLGDPEQEKYEFTADAGLEARFSAKAGSRLLQVAFLEDTYQREGALMPRQLYDELLAYKGGDPAVDSVSISGPYNPVGLGQTQSRQKIFVCSPVASGNDSDKQPQSLPLKVSPGTSDNGEDACVRRIVSQLARRAYRRPVTEQDVTTLLKLYRIGHAEGGFEAGVRTAIQGILVNPEFLFRVERDPVAVAPGTSYRIPDLELASRLSFFLWSTIPDDQLLDLAERGRLTDPVVLEQEVRRMLADPRAKELSRNFAGQWLGLRLFQNVSPNPDVFPDFDDNLREAIRRETELFAESIIREDRSVFDLLDADYTFLNERLARHYGIPNIYGGEFRRVTLPDDARRGLLGKASVLVVSSYANRTAPTLRGKWVLENILGAPPPAPPPNVPSLKEDAAAGKVVTMRERLQQHRSNAACASCHARMDPLGFALENFDAVGKWRTVEGTTPIDVSGSLPDGTKFQGPTELRNVLWNRRRQFASAVTEKLLMYATGRGLEYYDRPAIRSILREAAPSNYRWSALVSAIVKSTPFQMRRREQ